MSNFFAVGKDINIMTKKELENKVTKITLLFEATSNYSEAHYNYT